MAFLCCLMLNALILFPIVFNMLNGGNASDSEEQREITCLVNEGERRIRHDRSGVDMISNLPSGILDNIFRYMPLEEIMRTSVLSREWRYKWVTCPEIVVEFDPTFLGQHNLEPIMFNILRHHQGPLLKFIFDMPYFESCPQINEWIRLLPSNTLQEFTLCVQDGERRQQLGSHLWRFQNLRKLKLEYCEFEPPFMGFKNLVKLKLICVDFVPQIFGVFLDSCPALEALELESCTDFDCLEIAGPKMKLLKFYGLFKSISFKDCPLLRAVSLSLVPYGSPDTSGLSFYLVKSLSCLPALEELKLQAFVLQDLVHYGAPNKLTIALKKLKKFKLSDLNFKSIAEISSAICFIRSCPNLESLNIISYVLEVEDGVTDFLRSLNHSKCFSELKYVMIRYFIKYEPEMEFVKFLLASSTVLKELVIKPPWKNLAEVDLILDKLQQYPRASPMVKLVLSFQ